MTRVTKSRIGIVLAGLILIVLTLEMSHYKSWEWTYERSKLALIDDNAPLQARAKIDIAAPPEKVWRLIANASDWLRWEPSITETIVGRPVQSGMVFSWTTGGMQIDSRFGLVQEPNVDGNSGFVTWAGQAYQARAIHVWKVNAIDPSHTRVEVLESMNGFLIWAFYSSKKLQESDEQWLKDLKIAAEK